MYILLHVWFIKLIRQFFFTIDKVVFNFISEIYDVLILIARTSILSQADILDMASRVYKLLAVFMIFKVTLSIVGYVVNPDDFADKTKGVSKLGVNVIISLGLLILTPYVFSLAYRFQTIVLEDNSLATVIFGDKVKDGFLNTAGDQMAFTILTPFYSPNLSIPGLDSCINMMENGVVVNDCKEQLKSVFGDTKSTTSTTDYDNYINGLENSSLGLMFRKEAATGTYKDGDNELFIMDYKIIFSTAVGVVVCLLLLTFCMDIGIRSIKLAFLQLVAPIPIISYVDPKSGKDGLFKKWYQMCFKTYLSLFIRLLTIYFSVYIISLVSDGKVIDIVDGSYISNQFVIVFIIIGALMFAKQLPKILEGLGIKLDGDGKFTLNPLKKFEEEAIGGKQIGKGVRGVGKYAGRFGKGLGTAALVGGASLVTGHGFRGTGKAMGNAWKGKKFSENFSNSYGAAKARHKELEEMKANGVKPSDVRKEKLYNFFHGTTKAEKVAQVENKAKALQSKYDTIKNQAIACDSNDNSYIYKTDENGNRIKVQTKSAKTISKELDEMKKTQIDRNSFKDIAGKTKQQQFDEAVSLSNSRISELSAKKTEYQSKVSDINLEMTKLKREQFNLNRDDFSSENDYYEAYEAYQQRLVTLEQDKQRYDFTGFDEEIEKEEEKLSKLSVDSFTDIKGMTADEQYEAAYIKQKDAIKDKEAELEKRINALANNEVYYINKKDKKEVQGTGNESADKVIGEAKQAMITLKKSINDIGREIDDNFKEIEADADDVVMMMKQSKGSQAQTTTGKMSDIKDVARYADKKGK